MSKPLERARSFRRAQIALRTRRLRRRRGVALLMVLGALVILTVFVTELQTSTSATLSAALSERDSVKAEYNAKSAINLSRLLIATEPAVSRSLGPILQAVTGAKTPPQIPIWFFTDMILGPFNDAENSQSFNKAAGVDGTTGKNLGLVGGHFELKIVDEDSKINVNAPVAGDVFSRNRFGAQFLGLTNPAQYNPLFEHEDQDGQFTDRAAVCGAIVDYVDLDETYFNCDRFSTNASQAGDSPEDNFYQQIGLPYVRKNAALDSLEELRQVRGMSDDFWATFVDPDPDDPTKRVMTAWGQDKINANSANPLTLLAIACAGAPEATLCTDPVQMENFVMAITLAKSVIPGIPIFSSPRNFTNALARKGKAGPAGMLLDAFGVDPVVFKDAKSVQRSIATSSKVFSIYADGVVPGLNRETRVRVHAVVDFRSAEELEKIPDANPDTTGGTTSSSGTGGSTPDPANDPNAALNALLSDPAGTMIYFRIE